MRSIPTHAPTNVAALDQRDPDAGNASHVYGVRYGDETLTVRFQHGPRNVAGSTPGVFDDDLLAIAQDRLEGFQSGPFACLENAAALRAVQDARAALADRVAARMAQGVLGENRAHSTASIPAPDGYPETPKVDAEDVRKAAAEGRAKIEPIADGDGWIVEGLHQEALKILRAGNRWARLMHYNDGRRAGAFADMAVKIASLRDLQRMWEGQPDQVSCVVDLLSGIVSGTLIGRIAKSDSISIDRLLFGDDNDPFFERGSKVQALKDGAIGTVLRATEGPRFMVQWGDGTIGLHSRDELRRHIPEAVVPIAAPSLRDVCDSLKASPIAGD